MNTFRWAEDWAARTVARSTLLSKLAVKVRNQSDRVIAYHLGQSAHWDANGEFALLECLLPEVKAFVDVGANVGEWSQFMMDHGAVQGFLFEPSAQCAQALRTRFAEMKCVVKEAAMSDSVGTAQFAEECGCGETSSLIKSPTQEERGNVHTRTVRVTTLDAEFPAPAMIDFLKIDTEGFDFKVLKGASSLLERTRFVQFEYNASWVYAGSSLYEAIQFLPSLGFSMYLVRSTGLHPFRYEFWGDYFGYSNFFLCREADLDVVRPLLRAPV
jgi:FkbM family methyltransferase